MSESPRITRAEAPNGIDKSSRSYFYVWLAVTMAATAFVGFIPTFWAPMSRGAHVPNPIIAIHGIVFSAWPVLLVLQTWLVASERTGRTAIWD